MRMKTNTTAYAITLLLAMLLPPSAVLGKPPKGGGGGGGGSPPPDPEIVYEDKGIRVMNADGSNQRLLVATSRFPSSSLKSGASGPSWSPDGTEIAFHGIFDWAHGVYVVDLTGHVELVVRTKNMGSPDELVDWSPVPTPDGNYKIVYVERPDPEDVIDPNYPGQDVFLVNPDGTGRFNLTRNNKAGFEAVWAPDGRRLLNGSRILHLGLDEQGNLEVQQVTPLSPPGYILEARWANHHDWIVAAIVDRTDSSDRIFILDLEAEEPQWQYILGGDGLPLRGRFPSFSPDDSALAFWRESAIRRINLDGTGERLLAASSTPPRYPYWKRPPLLTEEEMLTELLVEQQMLAEEAEALEQIRLQAELESEEQ